MNKLVSIIIPVYNVENYIDRCIESVINQTYSNLEIILVNDGSTDNSGIKCDSWEMRDSRIKVVHKSNGGLSSARNKGYECANGIYILFIDSDDYIEENMVTHLYRNLKKHGADVSACGYDMIYNNRTVNITEGSEDQIYNGETVFDVLLHKNSLGVIAWNKLIKKDLMKGIKFPEGKCFEDIATIYKILAKAQKIVYSPMVLYHYVQRNDSINGQNFHLRKFNETIYDMKNAVTELYLYVLENRKEYIGAISTGCIENYIRVINQEILYKREDEDFIRKVRNMSKSNFNNIISADYISFKKKLQIMIFTYTYWLYKVIVLLMKASCIL